MHSPNHHVDLESLALQSMLEHGFEPDFPPEVQQQLDSLNAHPPQISPSTDIRDLRNQPWSSIDNDTSRDLDQIEVAEDLGDGKIKVMIGIADVDTFAKRATPIDQHAARETTTVYTGVRIFPMLPEQLSTAASSLLQDQDRLAIVTEYVVDTQGCVDSGNIYRAIVRNKAQLAYSAVGAWLEGHSGPPERIANSPEIQQQIKLQDRAAQALKSERYRHGALNIESTELQPVFHGDQVVDVAQQEKNRASDLIEDFMIAANGAVARYLLDVSSIRRIVRTPLRWDRIVELAAQHGGHLPATPDSKALNDFLEKQKAADPDRFPEVSLIVVKLMGPGEYVLEPPGDTGEGHFGLAVQDYTHSTAPNRRFADVVTQRLIKAKLAKRNGPYSDTELNTIAQNCTQKENAARKVEREMGKRIAAVAMSHRVGETFNAIVTGAGPKGTFVRAFQPHIEGMLQHGRNGFDVGDRLRVKLVHTDPVHGYIDFDHA
ncbi:MAG: RNB domain-containing ribonuclease [Terriglobia bacterium]|nr:RNB domain-containing ribonuclease [Terriglobia bacterium]